jgi:hypothetical protein
VGQRQRDRSSSVHELRIKGPFAIRRPRNFLDAVPQV